MAQESFKVDPDAHAAAEAGTLEYHKDAEGKSVMAKNPNEEEGADDDKETLELAEAVNKAEGDETPSTEEDDKDDDKEEKSEEEKAEAKPTEEEEAHAKLLVEHQEMLQGFTDEFRENGDLSEESTERALKSIFAENLPVEVKQALLEAFKIGITSTTQLSTLAGWNLAGGQESYESMTKWADGVLSEDEKAAFNTDATGGDTGRATAAIKGLHARYQQAQGVQPNNEPDLSHSAGQAAGDPPIGSRQQLSKLVGSKEYKTDPAFRDKVDRQIAASLDNPNYRTS